MVAGAPPNTASLVVLGLQVRLSGLCHLPEARDDGKRSSRARPEHCCHQINVQHGGWRPQSPNVGSHLPCSIREQGQVVEGLLCWASWAGGGRQCDFHSHQQTHSVPKLHFRPSGWPQEPGLPSFAWGAYPNFWGLCERGGRKEGAPSRPPQGRTPMSG